MKNMLNNTGGYGRETRELTRLRVGRIVVEADGSDK